MIFCLLYILKYFQLIIPHLSEHKFLLKRIFHYCQYQNKSEKNFFSEWE